MRSFVLFLISCGGDSTFIEKEETLFEGDDPGECSDDADNDQDGLFDCDDDGCAGSEACSGEEPASDPTTEPTSDPTTEPASDPTTEPSTDPNDIDNDGDGQTENSGDCDDNDASRYTGATEICDGIDNDCDNIVDNAASDSSTFYADTDGDGYGDSDTTIQACDPPTGYVSNSDDCDDTNASIYLGASETPSDGIDQDCDGQDLQVLTGVYDQPGEYEFIVPNAVTMLYINMWGAGGAGGDQLGATGGGGAHASFELPVASGDVIDVMVGEGGTSHGKGGGASLLFFDYGLSSEVLVAAIAGGGGGASDGNSGNSYIGGAGGAGGALSGEPGQNMMGHQSTPNSYCQSATGGTGGSATAGGVGGTSAGTANYPCNGANGSYLAGGDSYGSNGNCSTSSATNVWHTGGSGGNGHGGAGGSGYYGGGGGGMIWTYCGGGGGGGSSWVYGNAFNVVITAGAGQVQGNASQSQGSGMGGNRSYSSNVFDNAAAVAAGVGSDGRIEISW